MIDKGIIDNYENLYDFDYYGDIALIRSDTPYVAIGNNIGDYANIGAINIKTRTAGIAHCGGEQIDRELPKQLIDAVGGNEKDIIVYVSPFAQTLIYDNGSPVWTTNQQFWEKYFIEENGVLRINMRGAIVEQLLGRKVVNMQISDVDTLTDENYYSNSRYYHGDKDAAGRFVSGIAVVDDIKRK